MSGGTWHFSALAVSCQVTILYPNILCFNMITFIRTMGTDPLNTTRCRRISGSISCCIRRTEWFLRKTAVKCWDTFHNNMVLKIIVTSFCFFGHKKLFNPNGRPVDFCTLFIYLGMVPTIAASCAWVTIFPDTTIKKFPRYHTIKSSWPSSCILGPSKTTWEYVRRRWDEHASQHHSWRVVNHIMIKQLADNNIPFHFCENKRRSTSYLF